MEEEDDIILADLDDEELVQQMFGDLYDGLKEEIEEGVNILLERKWEPYRILTEALVGGMTIVGQDFRDGILFVPEVLLAANAMKGGMTILKPLLAETGAPRVGKMVIGTVKERLYSLVVLFNKPCAKSIGWPSMVVMISDSMVMLSPRTLRFV